MTRNEQFADAVGRHAETEWALSSSQQHVAIKVLVLLYESICTRATIAEAIFPDSSEESIQHAGYFYQIQQLICLTPLRFFLKTLAKDSSLVIRAAAKGELFDREGFRWVDHETHFMVRANLVVTTEGIDHQRTLVEEAMQTEVVRRAFELWQKDVERTISFMPGMTIISSGPSARNPTDN